MPDAFVIMQIGYSELDRIFREVIAPALSACGLTPRRIDQDNEGGLLNAEIMASIERSDIIVADLTNERPNCYLEVGYALGLGRARNLVLTVRRDHLPGEPDHVPGGPKVHFDLAGYDLLLWDPSALDAFRAELEARVQRRLAILEGTRPSGTEGAPPWYENERDAAIEKIRATVGPGFMQLHLQLLSPRIERRQAELLDAAQAAQIRTFGWPIGLVLNADDDRPHPTGSSIRAVVEATRLEGEPSFDYWELRTDGEFFMVHSLFEDQRGHSDKLFFDTRIVRVTEALLYAGRLYDRLGVPPEGNVGVSVLHGGLQGRALTAANRARSLSYERTCHTDEVTATASFVLGELDAKLVHLVVDLVSPLFELFDFFELGRDVYESVVDGFVRGRMV